MTASSGSFSSSSTVAITLTPVSSQVNLAGYFNQFGIATDGVAIPVGGIDGDGNALSGTLLGTSQTWNASTFTIAGTTTANNVNNIISAAGQTISFNPGKYASVKLLGLHVNITAGATDNIVENYTDGTSQTIAQGFSDWYTYTAFTNQYKAVSMAYRDEPSGVKDNRTFNLFGYILAANASKTLQSITLPADNNLVIVAMDTYGTPSPILTAPVASPSPVVGTTTSLSTSAIDPTGDAAPTYTWVASTIPGGAATPTFNVNGTSSANVTTATFYQAGAYTFTVIATDPTSGQSSSTTLAVTVTQTLTSISLTPSGPVALTNGNTQQFSATASDQFGTVLTTQPVFTWSLGGSALGSVNSTGLYQAPASGVGPTSVLATSGTVTGSATVQVNQPAWLGAGSVALYNSSTHILTVTGAATIIADPGSDQPVIQANGASAVLTINPTGSLLIHIGGLSLSNGSSATVVSAWRSAHRD